MTLLIVFGALAALAAYATLGDEDLRWIGFWLVIGFILSNVLHASMSVDYLPGPYSLIEFMVLLATALAWDSHRNCWPMWPIRQVQFVRCWPLVLLAGINILSICINIAFSALYLPTRQQIYVFELTTNLCFTAECLLAIGVGVSDGLRNGRFARLSGLWRRNMASNVTRTKSGGT